MGHLRRSVSETCQTCEWVLSHIWMSHVTHMNESCHTYEWVMSHIWMSHVTNDSSRDPFVTHSWLIHDSFVTHSWLTCDSPVTHPWLNYDSLWMSHLRRSVSESQIIRDSFVTHSWLIVNESSAETCEQIIPLLRLIHRKWHNESNRNSFVTHSWLIRDSFVTCT